MTKFVYNGITLSKYDNIENLMIKQLGIKPDEATKTLTSEEFLELLKKANYTNSLDVAILKLKKFGFDITLIENLEQVKAYLIDCMEHSILKLNKQIKASKINDATYYRTAKAETKTNMIKDEFIDARAFYDECDYLINYLTNAVLCGEIIYTAEHQAINTLKQNKTQLENETTTIVDKFIKKDLNMEDILGATTKEDLEEVLKKYKKETKSK